MKQAWWMRTFHAPDEGAVGGASTGDSTGTGKGQGAADATVEGEKDKGPATYTQADVDRRVTEALQKREQKLREELDSRQKADREKAEREKAEAEGKFKELYERAEREKAAVELRIQTRDALAEKGLAELAPVFEADLSSLDARLKIAEDLKKRIDKIVEAQVLKRLETPTQGKGSPSAPGGKLTVEQIERMTQAEYEAAYRKGQIG
jgi:hypothetical protein